MDPLTIKQIIFGLGLVLIVVVTVWYVLKPDAAYDNEVMKKIEEIVAHGTSRDMDICWKLDEEHGIKISRKKLRKYAETLRDHGGYQIDHPKSEEDIFFIMSKFAKRGR